MRLLRLLLRSVLPIDPSRILMVWDASIITSNIVSFPFTIVIEPVHTDWSRATHKLEFYSAAMPIEVREEGLSKVSVGVI